MWFLAVALVAAAHLVRDGFPALGSTLLARLAGTGFCVIAGALSGGWLGAAFGLAVGVGFWTDMRHGEGQEARDWGDVLDLLCSGLTSLAPLVVAFALAGAWWAIGGALLVAALKPLVWFAAWRLPFVRSRHPTRWAATVFGALVGAALLIR